MSRSTALPVAVVVAVVALVHGAVATRYGWHPDEFYFVICGQHPAWGYFDQPPVVPLLARVAALGGLLGLRLLAIALHLGAIVLAALLAAELGGRRVAQVITAAAVAACPLFVSPSMFFGTTVVDQLIWIAVLLLVTRALRTGTVVAWLAAGVVAGIGLETKHTLVMLLIGIGAGLVVFRRDALRTPGPWLAVAVAAALAAPNVIWNATHGWPSLQHAHTMTIRLGGTAGALNQLFTQLPLHAGPLLLLLLWPAVRWVASPAGREHRWILVVPVVVLFLYIVNGGRTYYVAPMFAVLFAAAAVHIESVRAKTLRTRLGDPDRLLLGWAIALVASFIGAVLFCLPVLPAASTAAQTISRVNPVPLQTYGWPEFVEQVAAAASSLPPDVPIYTSLYAEASALMILGPDAGIRRQVVSADSSLADWGPPTGSADTVLCVGRFGKAIGWKHTTYLASIRLPGGVHNGQSTAKIYLCEQPVGSWAQMWPRMRHSGGVPY